MRDEFNISNSNSKIGPSETSPIPLLFGNLPVKAIEAVRSIPKMARHYVDVPFY